MMNENLLGAENLLFGLMEQKLSLFLIIDFFKKI